jgi:hypothetical protein
MLSSEVNTSLRALRTRHAGSGDPPEPVFAKGMCRACFVEFVHASGGADGDGADPPAFARALKKELAARQAEEVRLPPCC